MIYRLGIVGSEQAKFTSTTEATARQIIRDLLTQHATNLYHRLPVPVTHVVSGGCHLGGVDIFAKEEALSLGLEIIEHVPKNLSWLAGYKPRNIKIAEDSNRVICITVRELPESYTGMKFDYCYHCRTKDHVKSGGCWTTKYARGLGKIGETIVV